MTLTTNTVATEFGNSTTQTIFGRAQNSELRTQNAERRTQNAERRTQTADRRPQTAMVISINPLL